MSDNASECVLWKSCKTQIINSSYLKEICCKFAVTIREVISQQSHVQGQLKAIEHKQVISHS